MTTPTKQRCAALLLDADAPRRDPAGPLARDPHAIGGGERPSVLQGRGDVRLRPRQILRKDRLGEGQNQSGRAVEVLRQAEEPREAGIDLEHVRDEIPVPSALQR